MISRVSIDSCLDATIDWDHVLAIVNAGQRVTIMLSNKDRIEFTNYSVLDAKTAHDVLNKAWIESLKADADACCEECGNPLDDCDCGGS